jgi:hypothetical protein
MKPDLSRYRRNDGWKVFESWGLRKISGHERNEVTGV